MTPAVFGVIVALVIFALAPLLAKLRRTIRLSALERTLNAELAPARLARLGRDGARATLRYLSKTGRAKFVDPLIFEGLMLRAGMPVMAGGDGTATLRPKLEEANQKVNALEEAASKKWDRLEDAKRAFAESDADPTDTSSDAFKAVEEAGRDHDKSADDLHNAKVAQQMLKEMVAKERGGAPRDSGHGAPAGGGLPQEFRASLEIGQRVTDSDEYKAAIQAGVFESQGGMPRQTLGKAWDREELKTLLTSASGSAGSLIAPDRLGGIVSLPNRPLTLLELVTIGTTNSNLVQYVKQTLRTNAAGPQASGAEGGAKPESALAYSIVDAAVQTIAHWIPAVKQALADAGQLSSLIDGELRIGLLQYLMDQIVSGDGANGHLKGILQTTGRATPAPLAADGNLERIHRGITAVRVGAKREPTAVGLNPYDWEEIRLRRDASGADAQTGQFLMGSPLASALNLTVWGLVPAVSTAIPQGTAVVGDFSAYNVWIREGAQVLASDSHADYFTHNMVAVLAEMRAASGIPVPAAFAEVDLDAAGS